MRVTDFGRPAYADVSAVEIGVVRRLPVKHHRRREISRQ